MKLDFKKLNIRFRLKKRIPDKKRKNKSHTKLLKVTKD